MQLLSLFLLGGALTALPVSAGYLDDEDLGGPSPLLQSVVIGGSPANERLSNMMVIVTTTVPNDDATELVAHCSGTLIARDLVLTAAHCLTLSGKAKGRARSVKVQLGSGLAQKVSNWAIHPGYRKILDGKIRRPLNDLAILQLSSPFEGGQVAEIPAREMEAAGSMPVMVVGYGRTRRFEEDSEGTLSWARSKGKIYSVQGGRDYQLELTGNQPCNGDSGGAIFEANRLVLLGVTATVMKKCSTGGRAISVAHHLPWIKKVAREMRSKLNI